MLKVMRWGFTALIMLGGAGAAAFYSHEAFHAMNAHPQEKIVWLGMCLFLFVLCAFVFLLLAGFRSALKKCWDELRVARVIRGAKKRDEKFNIRRAEKKPGDDEWVRGVIEKVQSESEQEKLERLLQEAVKNQDYERAAELRDQLTKIQNFEK